MGSVKTSPRELATVGMQEEEAKRSQAEMKHDADFHLEGFFC